MSKMSRPNSSQSRQSIDLTINIHDPIDKPPSRRSSPKNQITISNSESQSSKIATVNMDDAHFSVDKLHEITFSKGKNSVIIIWDKTSLNIKVVTPLFNDTFYYEKTAEQSNKLSQFIENINGFEKQGKFFIHVNFTNQKTAVILIDRYDVTSLLDLHADILLKIMGQEYTSTKPKNIQDHMELFSYKGAVLTNKRLNTLFSVKNITLDSDVIINNPNKVITTYSNKCTYLRELVYKNFSYTFKTSMIGNKQITTTILLDHDNKRIHFSNLKFDMNTNLITFRIEGTTKRVPNTFGEIANTFEKFHNNNRIPRKDYDIYVKVLYTNILNVKITLTLYNKQTNIINRFEIPDFKLRNTSWRVL